MAFLCSLFACCSAESKSNGKRNDDGEVEPKDCPRVRSIQPQKGLTSVRHARAQDITPPAPPRTPIGHFECHLGMMTAEHPDSMYPPRYSDIPYDEQYRSAVWADEKKMLERISIEEDLIPWSSPHSEESATQTPTATSETVRSPSPALTVTSEVSSVISVPSTRLSGLTSSYTGATVRSRLQQEDGLRPTIPGDRRYSRDFFATDVPDAEGYESDLQEQSPPPSYYAESDGGDGNTDLRGHPVMSEGWLGRLRFDTSLR